MIGHCQLYFEKSFLGVLVPLPTWWCVFVGQRRIAATAFGHVGADAEKRPITCGSSVYRPSRRKTCPAFDLCGVLISLPRCPPSEVSEAGAVGGVAPARWVITIGLHAALIRHSVLPPDPSLARSVIGNTAHSGCVIHGSSPCGPATPIRPSALGLYVKSAGAGLTYMRPAGLGPRPPATTSSCAPRAAPTPQKQRSHDSESLVHSYHLLC